MSERDFRKDMKPYMDYEGMNIEPIQAMLDEIDRLRKFDEGKALAIRGLEIALDEVKKENESIRAERNNEFRCSDHRIVKTSSCVYCLIKYWKQDAGALRAMVKELETTHGLKCDNCGGDLEIRLSSSVKPVYQCKECKGLGYITKPSISIGMIPIIKKGD